MNIIKAGTDIQNFSVPNSVLEDLSAEFFHFAKENGIYWGTKDGESCCVGANPEWVMLEQLFLTMVKGQLEIHIMLNLPKELNSQ